MDNSADIITNGTLLSNKAWGIFKRSNISALQVTLDGPAETHNIRRKPKSAHGSDYDSILENLSSLPKGIHLAIRINCDRVVWDKIDTLLDDLERYNVWPQKAAQINIALAFVTTHDNARYDDTDWKYTYEQFAEIEAQFTDLKIRHYNTWAEKNEFSQSIRAFCSALCRKRSFCESHSLGWHSHRDKMAQYRGLPFTQWRAGNIAT